MFIKVTTSFGPAIVSLRYLKFVEPDTEKYAKCNAMLAMDDRYMWVDDTIDEIFEKIENANITTVDYP